MFSLLLAAKTPALPFPAHWEGLDHCHWRGEGLKRTCPWIITPGTHSPGAIVCARPSSDGFVGKTSCCPPGDTTPCKADIIFTYQSRHRGGGGLTWGPTGSEPPALDSSPGHLVPDGQPRARAQVAQNWVEGWGSPPPTDLPISRETLLHTGP